MSFLKSYVSLRIEEYYENFFVCYDLLSVEIKKQSENLLYYKS